LRIIDPSHSGSRRPPLDRQATGNGCACAGFRPR
jgi:hypothetical protein